MFRTIAIFFILVLLSSPSESIAQAQRFKAGVIFGVNLAQIDGDNSNGYIKPGFTAGLRGVTIISDKIDISLELLFDQRGSRSQKIFDATFFPFKITNNYVSVPVIFNYQDWLDSSEEYYKLHFHAGFAYNRLLNSQIDDEDSNSIFLSISEFFVQDDVSALVGATFYTGPHLAVTGRFSRSLRYLYRYEEGGPGIPTRRPFLGKHLTIHLLYMF